MDAYPCRTCGELTDRSNYHDACGTWYPHGNRHSPATRKRHDIAILGGMAIGGVVVFAVILVIVMVLAVAGGWGPGW